MLSFRRTLTVLIAAIVVSLPALPSTASTADDLETAKENLVAARAAANDARAMAYQAEVRLEETQARITQLEATIADLKHQAAALESIVRRRAVYAYTHAGDDIDTFVSTNSAVSAARGKLLIDLSNEKDNAAATKLAATNSDLRDQTAQLRDLEGKQRTTKDQLDANNDALQAKLAEAQQATADLQAKYDAEIAAAQEAARKAALEAALATVVAAQPVTNPTSANLGPGQVVASSVSSSFTCPVIGAAYTDDYGGPTGHPGIDMLVPIGTRALAVKAGTVRYVANEGAGGNTAYLDADDGNTYFYAHLSQFVGGARTVAQGEVIALTGMTGNATGPHLHFEIRLGGENGARTDPYPTLKAAGC